MHKNKNLHNTIQTSDIHDNHIYLLTMTTFPFTHHTKKKPQKTTPSNP